MIHSPRSTLCVISVGALSAPISAFAQCETDWSNGFGFPSPSARVLSLGHFTNGTIEEVIAGGLFTTAGGIPARHIASWSVERGWQPLPGDLNDYVGVLVTYQGELYAGGRFTSAGVPGTRSIARWNGQSWSSVGGGVQGSGTTFVMAMFEYQGELIVGGSFSQAGPVQAARLARWNGSEWLSFGAGNTNATVYDFAEFDEHLIACGAFSVIDGIPAAGVAKWDGVGWTELGGGISGDNPYVLDCLVKDTSLYACGHFTGAGGNSVNGIARWDGTHWLALGAGLQDPPSVGLGRKMCEFNGDLFVSGEFTQAGDVQTTNLARWNGIEWSGMPIQPDPPNQNPLVGPLLVHDNRLLVGGNYVTLGAEKEKYLATWDGESFAPLGTGNGANWQVGRLTATSFGLVALGIFDAIGDVPVNRIAVFDGSHWERLGGGIDAGYTNVAIEHRSNIFVGGSFTSIGGVVANGLAMYDGETWTPLPVSPASVITAAAVDGDTVLFAGNFGAPWELSGTRVIRWDGVGFSPVGTPADAQIRVLHMQTNRLYAGGSFGSIGGTAARRIAMWDGSTWAPLGAGVSRNTSGDFVSALASFNGELIVGGSFDRAGGDVNPNIARWTGSAWASVGGGVNSQVSALKAYNGVLYVGGVFTQAGGLPIGRVARWDGAVWSALAAPFEGAVTAIEVSDRDVYIGGLFDSGPGNSTNVARLVSSGPLGDLDGDSGVSVSDLAILLSVFGLEDPGQPSADFDLSGTVGLADLAILLAHFGFECP